VDVEIQVCFEQSPDEQNIFYFNNYFCESTALPQPAQANKQKIVCSSQPALVHFKM
jgi:hypothetical protein